MKLTKLMLFVSLLSACSSQKPTTIPVQASKNFEYELVAPAAPAIVPSKEVRDQSIVSRYQTTKIKRSRESRFIPVSARIATVEIVATQKVLNEDSIKPSRKELLLRARNAEQYCYEVHRAWFECNGGKPNHEAYQRWQKSIADWNNLFKPGTKVQLERVWSGGMPRKQGFSFCSWKSGHKVEDRGRNAPANRYTHHDHHGSLLGPIN